MKPNSTNMQIKVDKSLYDFTYRPVFVFFLGLGETYVLLAKHHFSQGFNGRAKLNCQDALQCLTRYMYLLYMIHSLLNSFKLCKHVIRLLVLGLKFTVVSHMYCYFAQLLKLIKSCYIVLLFYGVVEIQYLQIIKSCFIVLFILQNHDIQMISYRVVKIQ